MDISSPPSSQHKGLLSTSFLPQNRAIPSAQDILAPSPALCTAGSSPSSRSQLGVSPREAPGRPAHVALSHSGPRRPVSWLAVCLTTGLQTMMLPDALPAHMAPGTAPGPHLLHERRNVPTPHSQQRAKQNPSPAMSDPRLAEPLQDAETRTARCLSSHCRPVLALGQDPACLSASDAQLYHVNGVGSRARGPLRFGGDKGS